MNTKQSGWRARLLATAASGFVAALGVSAPAYAQDQAQEETADEGEIVITGFRASLRSSTETKREENAIVEVVTAEEIGKLPDNSIAESIARLPGLAAQRLFGRAQQISVRGLSPDFTTTLLNGREQVSAGDNRGVEFDQYPSELLSSVVVYKTPTAGLIGQGLAGTADLRTVRPLAYDDRVFAFSGRYEWNDIGALNEGSEEDGHRWTASYIDQTDDGRWGWAIGVASMSSPTQAERFEAWGYPSGNGTGPTDPPIGDPLPASERVLGGAKPYVQSSLLERDAVMGVLEFRPSNTFSSRIDAFYSEFNEEQTLRGIEFPFWWDCASGCGWRMQPGWTSEDGLVTEATFATEGVVRNDVRTRDTTVEAIGWNTQWDVGDLWSAEFDVSYSRVERHDVDLELYAGTGAGNGAGAAGGIDDLLTINAGNGSWVFSPTIDYADPSLIFLTDSQGWGQGGFIKEPTIEDQLTSVRLSAERTLENGPFSSWEFGVNHSQREKTHTSLEHFVDIECGINPDNSCAVPIPADLLQNPTSLDFLGIPGMVSFNPISMLNYGVDNGFYSLRELLNSDVIVKSWGVEEDVTVFYTQLNVDQEFVGVPVTGNVGMQFVYTDQTSTGGVASVSGPVVVTQGDDYLEMLPSLNLSFEVAEDNIVRLGIARTLARPRMDEMRASFAVNYNVVQLNNPAPTTSQTYWSGSGGNPLLRPWIADSIDLSYERYLGDSGGYIALAAFYKYLESYIYPEVIPYDFTGFPSHNGVAVPATYNGFAFAPQNGSGGYVQGLEFTANIPAEVFFQPLEGFGIVFNASVNDSDIQPPNTPGSALPGLSEKVINTTLYYERGGFEARVSNRYRSEFLGEVTGFGAGRELRFINEESVLDAQLGYRFGGSLDGLAIQFQANNITDEPFSGNFEGNERLVRDYQTYGTTYLVGFSYRR